MKLKVLLQPGEDGWIVATVPAFRGCISQGRTREEALSNIREAARLWLEVQNELPASGAVEEHLVLLN